jgi:hypothetical protein
MFTTKRIVDGNQYWHGELYPRTLGIDPKIKRQIGDIS